MTHESQILIDTEYDALKSFSTILQSGILIPVNEDMRFIDLLLSLPGFSLDYLENSVQTIFVNGVPLDDINQKIHPGSIIALSAAMPGLAGAIFRRSGVHGSLRSKKSASENAISKINEFVRIKFFNSIAIDRAKDMFKNGIIVDSKSILDFIKRRSDLLIGAKKIEIDGKKYDDISKITQHLTIARHVRLKINAMASTTA